MKNKEDVKQFFSWNIIIIQLLKIIISETEAKIISSKYGIFLLVSKYQWKDIKRRMIFVSQFPSPLPPYLNSREKMSEGTLREFGEKIPLSLSLCPAGLTGPAGDAGASVATGMSRNARRTVTPTSIARCCTAWHGDNHRPRTRREEKVERERDRERELV